MACEVLHSIHKDRSPIVIIKLDMMKAYNKVRRPFLFKVLESFGFNKRGVDGSKITLLVLVSQSLAMVSLQVFFLQLKGLGKEILFLHPSS